MLIIFIKKVCLKRIAWNVASVVLRYFFWKSDQRMQTETNTVSISYCVLLPSVPVTSTRADNECGCTKVYGVKWKGIRFVLGDVSRPGTAGLAVNLTFLAAGRS